MSWLRRGVLLILFALSLSGTWQAYLTLQREPLLRPLVERTQDEILAAIERDLAEAATPEFLGARMGALLGESRRNWIAIEAVESVAAERGIPLPDAIILQREAAWEEESGFWKNAGHCALCAYDASACTLRTALMCNAPITFTPIGDGLGIARAGIDWASGDEVDQIDLALSTAGLAATAAVLVSGGSSATVKLGASIVKLARKMGILSPRLLGLLTDAARNGIDWGRVRRLDMFDTSIIRPEGIRPLVEVAGGIGRIGGTLSPTQTLHMLRYIDDAADARNLARATEAVGPRIVGRIEVLGKARILRATARLSDFAIGSLTALAGLFVSLAMIIGSVMQAILFRGMRRAVR